MFVSTVVLVGFKKEIARFVFQQFRLEVISRIISPGDIWLEWGIGYYYFGGGAYDLNKARDSFKRALSIDPLIPTAHYQLARIYFIKGRISQALYEINKEIELHPESNKPYYVRGLILGYRNYPGDLDQAEEDFRRSSEDYPFNWAGYNDLAWIQMRQEKFSEAKKTVLQAFETIPTEKERNVWLWANLGVAEMNLENYNEAKEYLLTAQEISNKMTAGYFWSAYPGNNQKNATEAFKQFRATLHFNLGIVYENLNSIAEAKTSYETYLSLLPQGPFPQKYEVQEKILTLEAKL